MNHMGGQREDLYCNFSRKDLQGLCMKYGLPANKSNSEMATSLILYLEKKNLNSRIIWEATRSDPFPLGAPELQTGRRTSAAVDRRKDIGEAMSSSGSGNNQCSIPVSHPTDQRNCMGPATSDKAFEDVGISSQLFKDRSSSADLQENTFSCVIRSPVQDPSPNFQFDVSSEEGIQLCVDLDSSPSDWIESLKDGVHICPDEHKLESSSFRHDLGWLCCSKQTKGSLVNSYKEVDNEDAKEGSCPNTMGVGALEQPNELNGEGVISSPGRVPINNVHSHENLGEELTTTSSRLDSDIEKQVCGAKCCLKGEGTVTVDPDTYLDPQVRTCDSSGHSLSSDCKHPRISENNILNVDSNTYKEPFLQQMENPSDPVVVCIGLSASTSVEIRASSGDTLDQDRFGMQLDSACHPQGSELEHCELIKSVPLPKKVLQMQPAEAIELAKYTAAPTLVNARALDSTNLTEDNVDGECGKASTSSGSNGRILEAPKHLPSSNINGTNSLPYDNYECQGDMNLTNSIEKENGGILCTHEAVQEDVEMNSTLADVQRNDASRSSCSNGDSQLLVIPKQNGANHCTPTDSNEIDKDIQERQPTSVKKVGRVITADQTKSSECLDFRDSMAETYRLSTSSEATHGLKRKRQVNGTDGRSPSVKRDAKIPKTTRQFAGDIHVSRRRSSRLFTK